MLQAVRDSNSPDPAGTLRTEFFIIRCSSNDPLCSASTIVGSAPVSETVQVGESFALTLIWDSPNNQFIAHVSTANNPGSDVSLAYSRPANVGPAGEAIANLQLLHSAANCTAEPTEVDAVTRVISVETNTSAVIP